MTRKPFGETYLDKELQTYAASDYYPFHMPGHKRRLLDFPNPYSIDITEIQDFDNLHHAQGILLHAQQRAADAYGTKETFYLVNGSTCGILSAISAAVSRCGTLLMGRNSHKSVYHAAFLRQLETVYLLPPVMEFGIMGSVLPEDVKQALLAHPETEAIFITSPTYDGVVSDIAAISAIAHDHHIPLIVDEAHGAHFIFSDRFPASALECGADLVIHSLHKTLPCFTQTALIHVNSDRIALGTLRHYLSIYQTSSPSYLLMASMEQCLRTMAKRGPELMEQFTEMLDCFYEKAAALKHLKPLVSGSDGKNCYQRDTSKILISTSSAGLTGQELSNALLKTHHLQMEMASGYYVTALTSVMDTAEGFKRLLDALMEIDRSIEICADSVFPTPICSELSSIPLQKQTISNAMESSYKTILLKDSKGCISREFLYLYPPGIPLLVPGEVISAALLSAVLDFQIQGLSLEGLEDETNTRINIVNL